MAISLNSLVVTIPLTICFISPSFYLGSSASIASLKDGSTKLSFKSIYISHLIMSIFVIFKGLEMVIRRYEERYSFWIDECRICLWNGWVHNLFCRGSCRSCCLRIMVLCVLWTCSVLFLQEEQLLDIKKMGNSNDFSGDFSLSDCFDRSC